jgi:hypothetical protein
VVGLRLHLPNYLAALGADLTTVGQHASLDQAMRDAFRKLRGS